MHTQSQQHKFCVAPMMGWTDRHCRYFHRLLSRRARLYTEMITTPAILNGDRQRLLSFSAAEHPVALQLGGNEPAHLAQAALVGQEYGFCEINLNVGCPSDRVRGGRFGACLMAEPQRVGECVAAMAAVVSIPVTVKCRIGIDQQDCETDLRDFVRTVAQAGCQTFIVHARKAWLAGLSPKANRTIPPLNHHRVYRLKREFPHLTIVTNGGIHSLAEAQIHLSEVDGVMLGRAAYQTPYLLAGVDQEIFEDLTRPVSRDAIMSELIYYAASHIARGGRLNNVTRHILGLFHGQPRARAFRRHLSENAVGERATIQALKEARDIVRGRRESVMELTTTE
ncbi:MAG: tRNA dihydrouridine(20/20a) synthase DusA [Hyphomicrobiaceae bacterium]